MSIQDIQNKARLGLHDTMKRPAVLYDKADVLVGLVHVRRSTDVKAVGDLAGTNLSYAEARETVSELIFLVSEHAPSRAEKVVISATEGYFIDTTDPIDGITQKVKVTRLTDDELSGKTVPEDL